MAQMMTVTLLAATATALNAYAAGRADRSSAQRARLERHWSALIADARG